MLCIVAWYPYCIIAPDSSVLELGAAVDGSVDVLRLRAVCAVAADAVHMHLVHACGEEENPPVAR